MYLIKGQHVYLTIPQQSDQASFLASVIGSDSFLSPWVHAPSNATEYQTYLTRLESNQHTGFLIRHKLNQEIVGIINISEIVRGQFQSGYLGFYCFEKFAHQGLMTEALHLAIEYAFNTLNLHRLEANIQPHNHPSIALVEKCGLNKEGYSEKYLKINGEWCDHLRYAIINLQQT